jgi:hypothetical protein
MKALGFMAIALILLIGATGIVALIQWSRGK